MFCISETGSTYQMNHLIYIVRVGHSTNSNTMDALQQSLFDINVHSSTSNHQLNHSTVTHTDTQIIQPIRELHHSSSQSALISLLIYYDNHPPYALHTQSSSNHNQASHAAMAAASPLETRT